MIKLIRQTLFPPKVVDGGRMSLELLNDIFEQLTFEERLRKLYNYFDEDEILVTSSFGTQSVFLLHLIHKIRPTQKIYFIDTTFHFEETLAYKKQLVEQYNLQVVDIRPPEAENRLTREEAWWKDHPRMCCTINKVAPLEPIKALHKIWVSGLMAYQTPFRATLDIFAQQGDIIKFHPLIDIDEGEFLFYLDKYKLPRHPLEAKGYGSVGCAHCTKPAAGREGRWAGTKKTECGLHPGFFNRKKKKD